MTQEETVVALTPSEVLKRLKTDMPQNAPIRDDAGDIVGYEETGITAALNQLYSYDKEAVLAWLNEQFPAGVD